MGALDFERVYRGQTVLVTGDTGFTGSWLSLWLKDMGARVVGLALPPAQPSLFATAGLPAEVEHHDADIRDANAIQDLIGAAQPSIVFHLAAQALVRQSYSNPLETYATNVMGTANVLEACRHTSSIRAIIAITTDKVYRNNEWDWGYRETDALGGKDPYSASKAACEFVISSYRDAFFAKTEPSVSIAVARAGNIIGGGDWAADRIVADIVRSITNESPLKLRNPNATRPWQHVLAACHGYLLIGAKLMEPAAGTDGAWNIGPDSTDTRKVIEVIDAFARHWRRPEIAIERSSLAEAGLLTIDATRARTLLGWRPGWTFDEAMARTACWYRGFCEDKRLARDLCASDLAAYRNALRVISAPTEASQ